MIDLEFLPVPIDVILGLLFVGVFGLILGALIYLPIANKTSGLPLEKLSSDLIWRYFPDWCLILISCIIFLVINFMLIGGMWRI